MFFRTKPAGSYRYLQIVHSVREGKKVNQQVIATLGRLDLLQASGQLERLMRSGLRHCQSFTVIDAHAAGEIQPVTTLVPVVKRMRERFRIREITVVANRGMVSQATSDAFENSDPPVRYIVGVRMRCQKEVSISVLGSRARWFESVPERSKAKDPAPLKVKEVWVEDRRYVVCLNEEERRKDAHDREAIVAHF
jgi:hypothetical protein